MADVERAKRQAAARAVEEVADGMVLGLGSGSTAAYAIREIGDRIDEGLDVVGVPTSRQAAFLARDVGVPVRCLDDVSGIDLALDGADQVAGSDLIKGGGGAHAREKVIDAAAARFAVLVDESKVAATLDLPVPVEILPDTRAYVEASVMELGGDPVLRTDDLEGPAQTDNGNLVLDCGFGTIDDPPRLARKLANLPGVVEHGVFHDLADVLYVGSPDNVECVPV